MAGRPARLKVDIVADAKGVDRGVDEADRKFGKLGRAAGKAGAAIGAGLLVAGGAAVGFAVSAVGSASKVEQSMGALESVYGENARQVKAWADQAAQAVGLSKAEYADLSAVVGSQLQGMGMAQADAAAQSDELIRMGADLAATFGGSVSDAVSAVGSLLRGERDPIERYGVSIKAADVQARLAEQGLDKLTGAAKTQAETQATLALLTDKTKSAQGAFGRESNTLAGQQERLRAQFENVKATIGERLIPVATRLMGWLNNLVSGTGSTSGAGSRLASIYGSVVRPALDGARSAVETIRGAFERNRPAIEQLIGAAQRLAPVVGAVLGTAFRAAGAAVSSFLYFIGGVVGAVSRAVAAVQRLASAIRNSPVGGMLGAIFGGPPLAVGTAALAGGVGSLATGAPLATAALATGGLGALTGGSSRTGTLAVAAPTNSVTIRVGTLVGLDGPDVARQLSRLLDDAAVQLGHRPTFAGRAT